VKISSLQISSHQPEQRADLTSQESEAIPGLMRDILQGTYFTMSS